MHEAVERDIRVAVRAVPCPAIGDVPAASGAPTLTPEEVSNVVPRDGVFATSLL
jgi:hypothetical protein